jgi:hypothetical protein
MRLLASLLAVAGLLVTAPAMATQPKINVKALSRHAHHVTLHGLWGKIAPKGANQMKSLGTNLLAHFRKNAHLNPQQLEAHALAEAKKLMPKANPEQLHHFATMAMHHATDLIHSEFGKIFGAGGAKNAGAAVAAKASQAAHDLEQKAHDMFSKGIGSMMSKFKPANIGNMFKGLF